MKEMTKQDALNLALDELAKHGYLPKAGSLETDPEYNNACFESIPSGQAALQQTTQDVTIEVADMKMEVEHLIMFRVTVRIAD